MRQYVIYFNPSDYPNKYVVRGLSISYGFIIWDNQLSGTPVDTIDEAREFVPEGMNYYSREVNDDPVIVEVWL